MHPALQFWQSRDLQPWCMQVRQVAKRLGHKAAAPTPAWPLGSQCSVPEADGGPPGTLPRQELQLRAPAAAGLAAAILAAIRGQRRCATPFV